MHPPRHILLPRRLRFIAAFSLVELLVAIAIVAVLAALLTPVVKAVVSSSRDTRCVSNLRQIGAAIHIYAADNGGKIPPKSVAADRTTWQTKIQPYLNISQPGQLRKSFTCPSAKVQPDAANPSDNRSTYGLTVYSTIFTNLVQVADSPVLLVVDMPTANIDDRGPWNDGRTSAADRKEMFRHKNHTAQNGVFTDGHVESMKPSRAGVYLPEGSASAWLPQGFSFRFPGYWITPTPSQPTDDIR